MNFEELLKFIEKQDKVLIKFSGHSDSEKKILARTVKLNEEVGELCNEVLGFIKDQRGEKLDKFSRESLEGEVADVLITTLLVAKSMDVDVKKALRDKIAKIKKRYR